KLFDYDPNRRWEERAYVAIQKALALDPDLADAYLARGKLTWTLANHFPHARAIQDMKRALALNPNLATAHYWLGGIYLHIGLLDKALQELRLAVSLDPSELQAPPRIARVHWYQQQFDTALVEFERMPGWEITPRRWHGCAGPPKTGCPAIRCSPGTPTSTACGGTRSLSRSSDD